MAVKLFGIDFDVELAETKLSTLNLGESQMDRCLITIQQDIPLERQQQVFVHELIHVLLDGEEDKDAINEGFVRRLGNNLTAALLDNDLLAPDWWQRVIAPRRANLVQIQGKGTKA